MHKITHITGFACHTMKPPASAPVMHMMITTVLNTAPRYAPAPEPKIAAPITIGISARVIANGLVGK